METRELFWSLGSLEVGIFYGVGIFAMLACLFGIWRHVDKYRKANRFAAPIDLRASAVRLVRDLVTHRTVKRRDRLAGLSHAAIFWGFLIAFAATTIITIDHDIIKPVFGVSFWKGNFYLLFSLIVDIGGLALLVGLCVMAWRRWVARPAKLDYRRAYRGEPAATRQQEKWRTEDQVFLIVLIVITASGFLQEGFRLHVDKPPAADWSPVGYAVALLYQAAGMTTQTATTLRLWGWWSHGILALAFIAAVPWYKAKHIVAVLGSLLLRDEKPLRRLPPEPEDVSAPGVAKLSDFTMKDMLDFDACTKCGRCHEACPAAASGYPLSPRDLILDLRTANKNAASGSTAVDMVIRDETLWACLSCGACQEICPVGIEHPSKIVRMRRSLVDEGRIDPMLQTTFSALGNTGNSFGEPPKKRSAWTEGLDFRVKDIRQEPADYLWFVGDYASFDPRNQVVSRTVARLLRAADVDFALLHEGEHSAGNDVRRAGEEGLFSMLAEHNLAEMNGAQPFTRIITTDPHSYNTIRNEYPEYQAVAEIEHYSTLLARLLREGRLKVTKPLNRRVTFHDPCHLGRLNGGYDAPREVLELIGCEVVEMPRNRDNSFCCGAGGGRIWMPHKAGEKPSENRMHEAAALVDIDAFITCCPKDLNMFEDANKTSNHAGAFTVEDLAELVADAVELDKLKPGDLPALVKQIVEKSSHLIADAVMQRLDQRMVSAAPVNLPAQRVVQELAAPAADLVVPRPDLPEPMAVAAVPTLEPVAETPAAFSQSTSPRPVTRRLRAMNWADPVPLTPAELKPYEMPERLKHRILVAVKHAGVLGEGFRITDGMTLAPDAFDHKMNEWDEAAMEEALLMAERIGDCEVVAVTIGDEDAEASLRKALAMGADRGVRIWHESLADADPMTIARGLAGVAALERPDLILTGVQSADLGNGSTGTALAGILGLPHMASIVRCDWDGSDSIALTRELEGGIQHRFAMSIPAVLTIQTGGNQPRYATMRMIKLAKKKPVAVVDGQPLDDGSSGAVVRRIYEPAREQASMLGGGATDVAAFIIEKIKQAGGA